MKRVLFSLLLCASAIVGPSISRPALGNSGPSWTIEDTGARSRPKDFSLMLGLSPMARGAYPGVRLALPLKDSGLIPDINDALFIEFGGHFSYGYYRHRSSDRSDWEWRGGMGMHLPVLVRWNFYLTDSWEVFAALGLAIHYSFHDYYLPVLPAGGFGAFFKLQENLHLRLDAGEHLSIGLNWRF